MFRYAFKNKRRKGFTLVEAVITVGIVAILCAIAIPSIFAIKNSLDAKQRDNYAKSLYLAAQTNLTLMHSQGTLPELLAAEGAQPVPAADNADFPDDPSGYYYALSGDSAAFNLLLPFGSIDETIRSRQILVEYNPVTGSVYSVFYGEGNALTYDTVARDRAGRKALKVGYYDGLEEGAAGAGAGGNALLGSDPAPVTPSSSAKLSYNADSGILTISVQVPDSYIPNPNTFKDMLTLKLTITGESSGYAPADPIDLNAAAADDTDPRAEYLGSSGILNGNPALVYTYKLDTLAADPANDLHFGALGNSYLPGENVELSLFAESSGGELIKDAKKLSVNPLFFNFEGTTITINNARHLQNLNSYSQTLNRAVSKVDLKKNIDFSNDASWPSGRSFTPISNAKLFGAPEFQAVPADSDTVWNNAQAAHPGRGIKAGNTVLNDVTVPEEQKYASFNGNNKTISNLTISDSDYSGLFASVNAPIRNLTVAGAQISGGGTAVGTIAGCTGYKAQLVNCRVTDAVLTVTGSAVPYVGGMVGYAAETEITAPTVSDLGMTVATSADSCIGGIAGVMEQGSLTNGSVTGSITKSGDGDTGCVGGAVGSEIDYTTDNRRTLLSDTFHTSYSNMTAAVTLSSFGGAEAPAATDEDPSGLGVNVGKFIGHVLDGVFSACSATGSADQNYQFLGSIACTVSTSEGNLVKDHVSFGSYYELASPHFLTDTEDDSDEEDEEEEEDLGEYIERTEIYASQISAFRNVAVALPGNTATICSYKASLDNCRFISEDGKIWLQEITENGFYRESSSLAPVTNGKLEKGKTYYLLNYDGSRIMYADTSSPRYYSDRTSIVDGCLRVDPTLDLAPCVWEYDIDLRVKNHLNLYNPSVGKYLCFYHGIVTEGEILQRILYQPPFMSKGYKTSNRIYDVIKIPFLPNPDPEVACYSLRAPYWTYAERNDGTITFFSTVEVDRGITEKCYTYSLLFNDDGTMGYVGSNDIGLDDLFNLGIDVTKLIFGSESEWYGADCLLPPDNRTDCKFLVYQAGSSAAGEDSGDYVTTVIDYLDLTTQRIVATKYTN